ncbi:DNA-binding NarL/FixJ family response regulator [Dyadobacter jejuensis]|uniref:DNA-binding NarL/FixJ family response regulator n=1 Tax=Dyadobacter jejuensis TaxID=1082580 RepID=A0A316AJD8_9BACT|nr:response regulator transcription factor [Dyadobacter jejuensis]PWJ57094.1 DNA-binding NarL/FixJ family response regulator [Dyadobacter jejuensis]
MLNIFIIDHRPIPRFGIRYLLNQSLKNFQLHDFNSVNEISSRINLPTPNLIFIGADPELPGIQILQRLKRVFCDSRFIVYDLETKAGEGVKFFRSGAHGFLSKLSDLDSLSQCLKTVMDGKLYLDAKDLTMILEEILVGSKPSQRSFRQFTLSQRQKEIASLFAKGMGTSGIAKKLGLSPSTVSTVKAKVYQKLNINNVVDLKSTLAQTRSDL